MGVEPIIELRDLSRSYRRGSWALDGIGLTVRTGEVVGLLGRNGAGKTTLLRCVMGMIRPQHGSVTVLGLDPWQDAVAMKKRIGFVSASQVFPRFLTVAEVTAIHRGLFPSWDTSFERRLAERFDPADVHQGLDELGVERFESGFEPGPAADSVPDHEPQSQRCQEHDDGLHRVRDRHRLESS